LSFFQGVYLGTQCLPTTTLAPCMKPARTSVSLRVQRPLVVCLWNIWQQTGAATYRTLTQLRTPTAYRLAGKYSRDAISTEALKPGKPTFLNIENLFCLVKHCFRQHMVKIIYNFVLKIMHQIKINEDQLMKHDDKHDDIAENGFISHNCFFILPLTSNGLFSFYLNWNSIM